MMITCQASILVRSPGKIVIILEVITAGVLEVSKSSMRFFAAFFHYLRNFPSIAIFSILRGNGGIL